MKGNRVKLIIIFLFLGMVSQSQNKINSPYSRYGLGKLSGRNVHPVTMGMGGLSIGYSDPSMVNPANPASYAVFDSTTFIFEAGIRANITNLKTTTLSEDGSNVTLSHIFMGFPVTRWWRSSLGILPFSKIGYKVDINVDMSEYNFANVINRLEGDGGLNELFWGNSFKIGDRFRAGINANYVFGTSTRSSMVLFPDSLFILGTRRDNVVQGGGFLFDLGFQYDMPLKNDKLLTIGLVGAPTLNLSAKRKSLVSTFSGGYNEIVEKIIDTISYEPDEKGNLMLPLRLGTGFVLKKPNKWLIGADFEWQNWENFKAFGADQSLKNSWKAAIGGEFIPKHTSISSLFSRITYRMGVRYNKSYLHLLNNDINEFGISFGLSLPMRRSRTAVDIGVELGRRGTTKDKLIQENFVNFTLGVSIFENWFYKRKYQ